jgi:hypothetical protein
MRIHTDVMVITRLESLGSCAAALGVAVPRGCHALFCRVSSRSEL